MGQEEIEKLCTQYTAKSDEPLTPAEISTLADSAFKGYAEERYSVGCSTFPDLCDKPKCPLFQTDDKPNWDAVGEPISFDDWRKTIQANFPALWTYAQLNPSNVSLQMTPQRADAIAIGPATKPKKNNHKAPTMTEQTVASIKSVAILSLVVYRRRKS